MSNIQIDKIMVALAMNGDEERVIAHAVNITAEFGSSLTAVHVNDIHAGKMTMMMDAPTKFTEKDIRERFSEHGFDDTAQSIQVILLESESPAKAIGDVAKGFDLLVLGHRPQSTFKMNFFDSVDEGIVNNVECPVLVVPKI
jgi:nucleotide-binding universal stress UspA family protein